MFHWEDVGFEIQPIQTARRTDRAGHPHRLNPTWNETFTLAKLDAGTLVIFSGECNPGVDVYE